MLSRALEEPEPLSILDWQGLGKEHARNRRSRARGTRALDVGLTSDLGPGPVAVDARFSSTSSRKTRDTCPPCGPCSWKPIGANGLRRSPPSPCSRCWWCCSGRATRTPAKRPVADRRGAAGLAGDGRAAWRFRAARAIEGRHGSETRDALQLAAALGAGCGTFLTRVYRRSPRLPPLARVELLVVRAAIGTSLGAAPSTLPKIPVEGAGADPARCAGNCAVSSVPQLQNLQHP